MARDLAIDLGTANTLVYMKGRGIVLNEPSVIALNRQTGEVLATGREAWQMIGRTPGYIVAVRPLRGGAITDFEITERMIRLLLQRVGVSRFTRPKVVICVPSAITEVERRAVTDAARRAGAADANLIEQPMAAAIGADLPIDEPVGNMVIDIGGGTSETAVISLGGIVALEAVRVGSFDIDAAIQNYIRREHGIAVGERTAEEIKMAIGSAHPTPQESQAEVRGRDLMTGLPKTVMLTPEEVRVRDRRRRVLDRLLGDPLSVEGAARALAGLPGAGHVPRRWRRAVARAGRAHRARDRGARADVERAARSRRARRRSRDRALRRPEGHVHGGSPLTVRLVGAAVDSMATVSSGFAATTVSEWRFPTRCWPPPAAASRPLGAQHVDRTDRRFVTLDPASSIDLDQAFAIELAGDDVILHYAIADVGWFVQPGDALDVEAFERVVTVYLPDRRATLYPPLLSEGAASLLPDVERPAVVFTVRVASDGGTTLDGVERAIVRNRAKLAYDAVAADDLPVGFDELHRRIQIAEDARGAPRVEFPEQEIDRPDDGRFALSFRPRLDSEEQNAALSLATNLAVAEVLYDAGTGLFRVMPDVDDRRLRRLRHTARPFGLDWPAATSLADFERSLPRADPRTSAFLIAVRRAAGGASYAPFDPDRRPWHAAIAATYAQATAPLRRLQDRYVIEATLAVANGRAVPEPILAGFERLPKAMAQGDQRANRVEREALELAESVVLAGREGEIFDAVVVDEGEWGVEVQIHEPAVLVRMSARKVDPGDDLRVRLVAADPERRHIEFERVS